MNEQNELYHYGVKGQKWGIIKEDSDSVKKEKIRSQTDIEQARYDAKKTKYAGEVEIQKALAMERSSKASDKAELAAKRKKYATIGAVAIAGLLILNKINRHETTTDLKVQTTVPKSKPATPKPKINAIKSKAAVKNSKPIKLNAVPFGFGKTSSGPVFDAEFVTSPMKQIAATPIRLLSAPKIAHSEILCHYDPNQPRDPETGQWIHDQAWYDAAERVNKRVETYKKRKGYDKNHKLSDEENQLFKTDLALEYEKEKTNREKQDAQRANELRNKTIQETGRLISDTAQLFPTGGGRTVHPDYSNIPDDVMRQYITRAQLEASYAKAKGEEKYIKSGSEKTRETLQTIGALVGIAGTIAAMTSRKNK